MLEQPLADGTGEEPRKAVVAVASNDDVGRSVFGCCLSEFIGGFAVTDFERPVNICGVEDVGAVAPTDLGLFLFASIIAPAPGAIEVLAAAIGWMRTTCTTTTGRWVA